MLDDINSELLSIYPGTFPNPRQFSRKPLVFNSGFCAYIRPPLPLYRIQCNSDYIAEKSKKAEATIRKLYKAAATSSSVTLKEGNTLFKHDMSPEAMLTKYREKQIYSKSRQRKVNRKQLQKAIALTKKRDDDESKKQYDLTISKIDIDEVSSKSKPRLKMGTSTLEPIDGSRKTIASTTADGHDTNSRSQSDVAVFKPNTSIDKSESKPKGALTFRKPALARDPHSKQAEKAESSRNGVSKSVAEYLHKEEGGEGRKSASREPFGNYTKIVTFKKNQPLKLSTLQNSSFPFTDQPPEQCRSLQKSPAHNEIDHMYKINDLHESLKARMYSTKTNKGILPKVACSDNQLNRIETIVNHSNKSRNWSADKNRGKQVTTRLPSKSEMCGTQSKASEGIQPKKHGPKGVVAETGELSRLKKTHAREGNYLLLPRVTPSLELHPRKTEKGTKHTLRFGGIPARNEKDVAIINYH